VAKPNGSRLITFIGEHEGKLMFWTPSWSGLPDEYEIIVDKEAGKVTCQCMDAICRKKWWSLYLDNKNICKHVRSLRQHVLPYLQKAGFL